MTETERVHPPSTRRVGAPELSNAIEMAASHPSAADPGPEVAEVAEVAPEVAPEAPQSGSERATPNGKDKARNVAAIAFVGLMSAVFFAVLRERSQSPLGGGLVATRTSATSSIGNASASSLSAVPLDSHGATDAGAEPGPPQKKTFRLASYRTDDAMQLVEATMGKRVFSVALAKSGIHANEAARILHAFEGVHSFDRTQPKDTFSFAREKASHRLVGFEYETTRGEVFLAREFEGRWVAQKVELDIQRRQISAAVIVGSELKDSLSAAAIESDMVRRLDEALDGHLSLSDIRKGGHLRIVATEMRVDGVFTRYETVSAVEYQSPRAHAPRLRVYAFGEGKLGGHYNEKGERPFHGGFRFPIALARITSRFNPRRMHPVLHKIMPHNGVDFAGSTGTPVYAVAAGTVKFAGDSGPCGNMVQISHNEGLVSAYCHLSKFAGVRVNFKVEPGQLLGYVGQTGRVTGPHLHFAMKRNGQFIDPLGLKMGGVSVLPVEGREAFATRKKELDAQLDAIAIRPADAIDLDDPDAGEGEFLDENLEDTVALPPGK